jgi:hypothetical protein
MTADLQNGYGALERGTLPRRSRASRNDHEHLFSNPVNAARLREAIGDSRAGRNLVPVTVEALEALLRRGET